MPRSETLPEPTPSPSRRLHLWRHHRKTTGGHDSLDSDDGILAELPVSLGASPVSRVAPAGKAASHESGSLSDLEDGALPAESAQQPSPSISFAKFRLGPKRDKSLPPQPASVKKSSSVKVDGAKAKAPRVNRLKEFTERLRRTDLRWSRDEKAASSSVPSSPPVRSLSKLGERASSSSALGDMRTSPPRRGSRPPLQPPISENKCSAALSLDGPMYRSSKPDSVVSLRERPASDSDLAWESTPSTSSASASTFTSTGPAPSEVRSAAPRTVAFRSASFSRLDSCGIDAHGVPRCPITVRPVSYSANRLNRGADSARRFPRRQDMNTHQGEEDTVALGNVHMRKKSDASDELKTALSEEEDIHIQKENSLLEAMLREIQLQSLSLQEQDTDAWLNRNGKPLRPVHGKEASPPAAMAMSKPELHGSTSDVTSDSRQSNETATARSVSSGQECSATSAASASAPLTEGGAVASTTSLGADVDDAARLMSHKINGAVSSDVTTKISDVTSIQGQQLFDQKRIEAKSVSDRFSTGSVSEEVSMAEPEPTCQNSPPVGGTEESKIPTALTIDPRGASSAKSCDKKRVETKVNIALAESHENSSAALLESKCADLSPVITVHSRLIEPLVEKPVTSPDSCVTSPAVINRPESSDVSDALSNTQLRPSTEQEETFPEHSQSEGKYTGNSKTNAETGDSPLPLQMTYDGSSQQDSGSAEAPNIYASVTEQLRVGEECKQPKQSGTRHSPERVLNRLQKSSQSDPSSEFSGQDSSEHQPESPVSSVPRSGTPQLVRQNATGDETILSDLGQPTDISANVSVAGQSHLSMDCLQLNIDETHANFDRSDDKENIRQAVKKAVQLLLTELNIDEDQEEPWFPGEAAESRTVSRSQEKVDRVEDLISPPPLRVSSRRSSATPRAQPESKTVDVVHIPDHGIAQPPPKTASQPTTPAVLQRRFRSRSLSPDLSHHGDPARRTDLSVLHRPSGTRRLRRLQNRHHRSFDWAPNEEKPAERRRSVKQRKASAKAAASKTAIHGTGADDASSSSSSEDLHSSVRPLPPKLEHGRGRGKGHGPRARTVSDSATLKPTLFLPLAEQATALPARRDASPSLLSYDSEPDGAGRGARRRLRGPYGELLEGKMTRGFDPPASLSGAASLPESPRSSSGMVAAEATARRRSRLVATSGSEGELGEPPQEAEEMLTDVLYDGVGPTAASLMAQLSEEHGPGQSRERKQDRRIFIIGELLDTEKLYVESLRLLVDYFQKLRSPELGSLVDPNALLDIFHMVPEILEIHEDFLMELSTKTDRWRADQLIGEVFLEKLTHGAVLETYTAFVNNWPNAREALLRSCQARPELAKFLEALERSNKRKLSLTHLLIMPVQRVPRYELLLKQLVSHTPVDHPDSGPLREACQEIHQLAARINGLQRTTMRTEAAQQALRDIEAAVDGLDGLVAQDREFLRHDMVSITTPAGTKKERCLFLFSDLLVIASIKRRPGSTHRKQTSLHLSSSNGIEPNKYKFLMKIPLTDISIDRDRAEDPNALLKEVERIDEDISTLRHMGVLVCKLHSNHHQVEELVREMAHVLNRELTERHRADSQLLLLPLRVVTEEGTENITVSFYETEKRMAWEQLFIETKEKLASAATGRRAVPRFLYPIPVRKTRAGLQFTCATATPDAGRGHSRDVWVCNSDGYVGQICTLSLQPEPAVTSCNGVCNSRILCMVPVPSAPPRSWKPGPGPQNATPVSAEQGHRRSAPPEEYRSHSPVSSPESDSSDESKFRSLPAESKSRRSKGTAGESTSRGARGVTDESKLCHHQPTMWLGTEDGCIYVYNCTDYVRVKKTTVKVHLGAAVQSMVYMDGRVFVGLSSGAFAVFSRAADGLWDTQSPRQLQVSPHPINKLANVLGRLWVCAQNVIKVVNPATNQTLESVAVGGGSQTAVRSLVHSGLGVWLSFTHTATVRLFHAVTFDLVCEVDVTSSVTRMLSGCDDIIRQHKTACLRVTSLMVCRSLLWIGTSAGVILNLPLPSLASNTSWITNTLSIAGISHGHTGHVRFLACVETGTEKGGSTSSQTPQKSDGAGGLLVISGGDGYEDFRACSSELSGRDDSTNHLLLWSV